MKLLTIFLLSLGIETLPNINDVQIGESTHFDICMELSHGESHSLDLCKSQANPGITYHITAANHCHYVEVYDSMGYQQRHCTYRNDIPNLFVRNGVVFEIPLEDLMGFYGVNKLTPHINKITNETTTS